MSSRIYLRNKNIFLINYRLFLIMLLLIPLYLFNNIYIKLLGSIMIITIFLLTIFASIYRMDKIKLNRTWAWFLIFSFYNVIILLRTPTLKALYFFSLQVILLFFISLLTSMSLDDKVINAIFKCGKILYFILLVPAAIIALEGGSLAFRRFNDYFSPVTYKIMLPCSFFFIANSKHKFIKILLFSLILLKIGERTSSIVLFIIYMTYFVLKKAKRSKVVFNLIFIGTFIVIIGFVYGYVELQYTEIGYTINSLFQEYTGGNFFSGRNRIWEIACFYIKDSPFWGYGLDNNLMHLAGIDLSTHNTYIHILLQGGIIGLLIFIMFLYTIWIRYFYNLDDDIVITAAAYLIGILFFINFEVTLIGNTVVTAIFLWLILGMGLIQCNNRTVIKIKPKFNSLKRHH